MDFDAEEIAQLRKNILEFVLQQLHESAARGELKQAGLQLSGPIGAEVEAAVARALGGQQRNAQARLGDAEISRIASAVARQIGGQANPAPQPAEARPDTESADADGSETWAAPSDAPARAAAPMQGSAWQRLTLPAVALIAGAVLGYLAAILLRPAEPSPSGTDSAQIVEENRPVATSDADLRAVEAPRTNPAPASTGAPATGSTAPRQ